MEISNKKIKIVYTVQEFCEILGLSRSFFYDQVRLERIKILKAGRKTLVAVSECDAYLRRLEGGK